ncbi:helix-turn-helix domain-containing protein [Acidovorax sp. GBBC 3334]|uniref:IclR family transcriptional regulator domain-containing protein n=1 Tax=unclassified Acidovorax TaxID=2684926 RepID=UPI002303F364|nr:MULTISPECIES: IclR family transcriptional regulator C-terminal domain-containing protein [unclassified Acidovorax]MDA8453935.1 helix-turn-helix domain-containing protein [Acidovorax sp. GBBC 3334]MDA8519311.1 helix-turn-helix domain-containing protein [Acidovorax sp. NCPPB 4044]
MSTEVRSVQRALLILRVMNERSTWSLQELHQRTGLAKSTLHRLLGTLEHEKYVRSDPHAYGQYQLTLAVGNLSSGVNEKLRLAELAAPLMISATRQIKWPLSLAVIDGHQMRVVFCTMPYSPYAIRPSSLGRRYDLLPSALGRAYLAYCTRAERRILVEAANTHGEPHQKITDLWALRRIVRETRRQGYAIRYARNNSESTAFAVPVFGGGVLRGALVYSTFASQMDDRMLKRFLSLVQSTAARIGEEASVSSQLPSMAMPPQTAGMLAAPQSLAAMASLAPAHPVAA